MNLRDAMAGGGALLTGAAFFLGAITERTVAPVDNAADLVVPGVGFEDELLKVCRTPETAFERTGPVNAGDPDLLFARLVEVNTHGQTRTTYHTWAEGSPNVIVEIVMPGADVNEVEPVTQDYADCMRSRAPTVAKEPFR